MLAHRRLAAPLAALVLTTLALAAPAPAPAASALARGCDPIDPAACLLPWPNDWFTRRDPATDSGRRLALLPGSTPKTKTGRAIGVSELNRGDGFSPGALIITRVAGLDAAGLRRSGAAPVTDPQRYSAKHAPVLVLDTVTGRRHPVAAEMDAQSASPASAALLVRAMRNYREGRRYVVVLRGLRRSDGRTIPAPAAFARIRDGRPRGALERERAVALAPVFRALRRARIARGGVYLAWDFTVASRRSLSERMLAIRDRAFGELGDRDLGDRRVAGRSPDFAITQVTDFTAQESPDLLRRVRGTVTVPCFLDRAGCPPGARFRLDRGGLPARTAGNVARAAFVCLIPRSVAAGGTVTPAQPVLYGHGLLGDRDELVRNTFYAEAANEHGIVFCATDWSGMASDDVPGIAADVLTDLTNFPQLSDRVQQGMLQFLFLGRAMIHPGGLRRDAAFQVGGQPLLNTNLAFNGNSQGGIIGGALTAIAPDFRSAALGVPGMNYATLLDRSTQFGPFARILYANYARGVERPLQLALIQQLWDRAEANGYAQHITAAPLPNTPRHEVLLLMAVGDHQVTNLATAVEARTLGVRLRTPALDPGRAAPFDLFWGLRGLPAGAPFQGSALLAMDSGPLRTPPGGGAAGTPPMPVTNTAPDQGVDPHPLGGSSPEIRRLVARYLRDGVLDAGCDGRPCRIAGWAGP